MENEKRGWKYYHTVWLLFFLAWTVSYVDRALMTPVITWMIANKVAFFADAPKAYTLGGLIGGLFFAGYMLVQLPAGFLGDRYGNKAMVVICIAWAGLATLVTAFASTLFLFVAFRVFTGLGEGALYSNDRPIIYTATPLNKRALGMGIAITGVSLGLTTALLTGAAILDWAAGIWGNDIAWRVPFLLWVIPTLLVAYWLYKYIQIPAPVKYEEEIDKKQDYRSAVSGLSRYAGAFLIIVMLIYYASVYMGYSNLTIGIIETGMAIVLISFIWLRQGESIKDVLLNKNLMCLNLVGLAFLWSQWFYGFWSPALIKEVANSSFMVAVLTALFFGGAGLVGYPIGGWISDFVVTKGWDRKPVLFAFVATHAVGIGIFGAYVARGGKDPVTMGIIIFLSGLCLFALQPTLHAMIAENAPPDKRSTAYGMWNLIAEIGAVMSPVVSGAIRDAYGGWSQAIFLDTAIVAVGALIVLMISKKVAGSNSLSA